MDVAHATEDVDPVTPFSAANTPMNVLRPSLDEREFFPPTSGMTRMATEAGAEPIGLSITEAQMHHLTVRRAVLFATAGLGILAAFPAIAQPGVDNQRLNQGLRQLHGVVQDGFGRLHVRDDHNNLQHHIDGAIRPVGNSVFGQTLSRPLIDRPSPETGALPAQYELLPAGIVDIDVKPNLNNGGQVTICGGSHGQYEPSVEYGATSGDTSMFIDATKFF